MYIYIALLVSSLVINFVSCETTKEPPKEITQKTIFKTATNDSTSYTKNNSNHIKSAWQHNRFAYVNKHPQGWGDTNSRYKMLLKGHALTKITKTLSLGIDPYFNKEYFEPFERRAKPVTLVAFRKNGILSRHIVKHANSKSLEVAELQSPYNEIGSFWQEDNESV